MYTAVYTPDGERIGEIEPKIVEEGSFSDILAEGPVLFIGDGALKCEEVIKSPSATFVEAYPEAEFMLEIATRKLAAREFEDVAYCEPFYLKQFVPTVSKKKVF